MALRDYILCKKCECKLIYDGGDSARERLEERWGAPDASMWTKLLLCPDCIKALEAERDQLLARIDDTDSACADYAFAGAHTAREIIEKLHDRIRGYKTDRDLLAEANDRLRAELEECKRDAERYRWIKASSTIEPEGSMWTLPYVWNWIDMPSPALNVECKSFDEAVDEAMRVDAEAALAAKGE